MVCLLESMLKKCVFFYCLVNFGMNVYIVMGFWNIIKTRIVNERAIGWILLAVIRRRLILLLRVFCKK